MAQDLGTVRAVLHENRSRLLTQANVVATCAYQKLGASREVRWRVATPSDCHIQPPRE
jgi:hypothetical protein